MKPLGPFGLPVGISSTFWFIVGLIRLFAERSSKKKKRKRKPKLRASDIAVIIPAHNEELVIRRCIASLKKMLHPKQIYVVSDGSEDKTYRRSRMEGCHVSYLKPGRGKARAMVYLLKRFRLLTKYKLIFIVDADTQVERHFIERALPFFDDKNTAVVFGTARIFWPKHFIPQLKMYFIAYRERLNRMLQYFFVYGQTWKYTNVNYVIPGFLTIYRSRVLRKLKIDVPGILIEDFNLAFQLHRKKLGKIAYSPTLIGFDQHPDNLRDYCGQIRRWNIGFLQTVKKNGAWPSFFWFTLAIFSAEVWLHSLFIILLPFYVITLVFQDALLTIPFISTAAYLLGPTEQLHFALLGYIFFSVFLVDYITTVIIGLINKKPQFIIYGIFFFFMHYIVSLVLYSSFIPGFFGSSSGRWKSPKRHTIGQL